MAPSRTKTTTTTAAAAAANNPTRRIMTRSIYKKQQQKIKIQSLEEEVSSTIQECTNSICLTPKGDKYMIPKISTCPPAPMKKRLVLSCSDSTNSASSTAKFFAHSDLDVFFLFAPRDIHA